MSHFKALSSTELEHVTGGYSAKLFAAMQKAVDMGLTINSTWTGGHADGSMHYKGRGFDSIGSQANMNAFYKWAAANAQPHELIYKDRFLKDGENIGGIGGHDNHVHFSV